MRVPVCNLLESWNVAQPRLRNAKAIALFLDFDGTLAPLRARPEQVQLPPATRRVLLRLSRRQRVRIWVISGRRRADVCERVGVPGIHCLGLYGWEDGDMPKVDIATLLALAEARSELAQRLDHGGDVWIEDKGATFALHYRGAPQAAVHLARMAIEEVRDRFSHRLNVAAGDHIWEVVPRELPGKGYAVRRYLQDFFPPVLPVYIGDDAGDESAFAALSYGITACVGPVRQTHANFRLRNPAEVRLVLERLDREAR